MTKGQRSSDLMGSNLRQAYFYLALVASSLLVAGCSDSDDHHMAMHAMHAGMEEMLENHYPVSVQDYNKLVIMDYMEALSTGEHERVAAEKRAPNYQEIRPEFHNLNHNAAGSELASIAEPMNVAIANRRDAVDIVMAEDDLVAVRYRISGNHEGNFFGIPATGKAIDIDAAALFWLEGGKITQGWFMADEAGLLKQIGKPLPAREDGRLEAGPVMLPVITGDEHLAGLLANPEDSQAYRNKLLINAYKSENPPEGLLPPPEEYGLGTRRGFASITNSASAAAVAEFPFGAAFPDRVDMTAKMMAEGKWVMVLFRLTATNSVSLFGIPALDRPISAYEIGFMEFDGENWAYRWFFGDDLGMLLQMGGPQDYWFQGDQPELP